MAIRSPKPLFGLASKSLGNDSNNTTFGTDFVLTASDKDFLDKTKPEYFTGTGILLIRCSSVTDKGQLKKFLAQKSIPFTHTGPSASSLK